MGVFDHVSWIRVAVLAVLVVAIGSGVTACFFPLYTRLNADSTTDAFYFWYRQYTKTEDDQKYMTRISPTKFDCPLARSLAIATACLAVAANVVGAVAAFLAAAHLAYRPKFGCCMAIMACCLASFLMMECVAVLSFYIYNYETCIDSDDWISFSKQNFKLGVGAFLTVGSCALFLLSALLETCS